MTVCQQQKTINAVSVEMSIAAGTRMASVMPCKSFLSSGQIVAKRPAANGRLFSDKIVGAKPNPSPHPAKFARCGVKVIVLDQPPLMKLLKDMWMRVELGQGAFEFGSATRPATYPAPRRRRESPRHVRKSR